MKRFFFLTIALAAVAVGCTKSGVLESPQTFQDQITFEPYAGKAPITKATIATNTTLLQGFRVIGFEETSNDSYDASNPFLRKMVTGKVTTTTPEGGEPVTTTDWSYYGAMFWPGGDVHFVAYGLNVNTTSDALKPTAITTQGEGYGDVETADTDIFTMNDNDYTSFTYEVPLARSEQKDLLISAAVKNKQNGTIKLELYHVLSRIGFSINILSANSPEVEITDIELTGNFITKGTYDLMNAVTRNGAQVEVSGSHTRSTYKFYVDKVVDGQDVKEDRFSTSETGQNVICVNNNAEERFLMIIPSPTPEEGETIAPPTITINYKIGDVKQVPATYNLENNFQFLPGKAYEFVFTLSTVAVGFNVEVETWDPDLDGDKQADDIETPVTPIS